jgi:hypothetical protein
VIPKYFTLINRRWEVKLVSQDAMQEFLDSTDLGGSASELLGYSAPKYGVILINVDNHRTLVDIEHTYLHELAHAITFADGVNGEHDERSIDRLGAYLHQYEQTKRGSYDVTVEGGAAKAAGAARRLKVNSVPRHRGDSDGRGGKKPTARHKRTRGDAPAG